MHAAQAGVLDRTYSIPPLHRDPVATRILRDPAYATRMMRAEGRSGDAGGSAGLLAVAALYALKNTVLAWQVIWHGIGPVH